MSIASMAPSALRSAVAGKKVLVTGASEGIGARLAHRLAEAGARVVLVARSLQKLEAVRESIEADGGEAHVYSANLSCEEECDRVLAQVLEEHGPVDILVSNAGRSIRRSVKYQGGERFHDFKRLMSLNYFGALRLILGALPGMVEQGAGHVIHVSSFGVPTRQPRFAGYCASKGALDAALQSAAGEVASKGVAFSTVYMPLVQTKMVESKGHSYDHVSMLSVDEACEYIEHAIITKRAEVIDTPSRFLSLMYVFQPSFINRLNALVYGLEGEQPPADLARSKSFRRGRSRNLAKGRPARSDALLACLTSLMWFFSRLELLVHLRLGVPWMLRDVFALLVVALVLMAQPLCLAAFHLLRAGLHCCRRLRRRARPQAMARSRPSTTGETDTAALLATASGEGVSAGDVPAAQVEDQCHSEQGAVACEQPELEDLSARKFRRARSRKMSKPALLTKRRPVRFWQKALWL